MRTRVAADGRVYVRASRSIGKSLPGSQAEIDERIQRLIAEYPIPLPALDDDTPLVKWKGGRPTIQEAVFEALNFQPESLSAD